MTNSIKTGLLTTAAIITLGASGAMAQGISVGVPSGPNVNANTSIEAGAGVNTTGSASEMGMEHSADMGANVTADADADVDAYSKGQEMSSEKAAEASGKTELSANHIEDAQEALSEKGFKVSADGVLGNQTKAALKSFQSANNLPATGKLDTQTLAALDIEVNSQSNW